MAADDELNERLRLLSRLLAMGLTQAMSQTDAIRLLARSGMDRREIAEVLGTTPNTVHARMSDATPRRPAKPKKTATKKSGSRR